MSEFVSFRDFLRKNPIVLKEANDEVVLVTDQNIDDKKVKQIVTPFIKTPEIELRDNGVTVKGESKEFSKYIDSSMDSPQLTMKTTEHIQKVINEVVSKMLDQSITKLDSIDSETIDVDKNNSSFVFDSKFSTLDYKGEIEIIVEVSYKEKTIEKCIMTIKTDWKKQ